jgi:hypothetical protein
MSAPRIRAAVMSHQGPGVDYPGGSTRRLARLRGALNLAVTLMAAGSAHIPLGDNAGPLGDLRVRVRAARECGA